MRRVCALACVPWFVLVAAIGCGDDGEGETANAGGASGAAAGAGSAGEAGGGSSGSGGSGGTAATGGGSGVGGASGSGVGGSACDDPGPEPNDSEALASPACGAPPCTVGDCDSDGSTGFGGKLAPATGVIGAGEVDFFKFDGEDKLTGCKVNPTLETADPGFRLCMFVSCAAGTKLANCKQGTLTKSPTGIPGCCTTAPGRVEAEHDCSSTLGDDDSAHVFIRVDEATVCTSYTVDYHF
jgi:hypothetical protein